MSHRVLSPQQGFPDPAPQPSRLRQESPHQFALPGMEHMAHPFAHHLAQGFTLQYASEKERHQLQVRGEPGDYYPEADLTWTSSTPKLPAVHTPGEVKMISNMSGGKAGKGLGPAMFHSAHYFDFGQTTVPIHSTVRTEAGEHFAKHTRPELRPDIRYNAETDQFENLKGERTNKYKGTWNLPEEFHPYQQQKAAKEREAGQRMRTKGKKPKGQGSLF